MRQTLTGRISCLPVFCDIENLPLLHENFLANFLVFSQGLLVEGATAVFALSQMLSWPILVWLFIAVRPEFIPESTYDRLIVFNSRFLLPVVA